MGKLNSYSYTALSTYHGCPHALLLKRERVTPIIPSYVTVGGLAHDAIQKYIEACLAAMVSSDPDLAMSICETVAPEHRAEVEEILLAFAKGHDCLEFMQAEAEVEFAFDANWQECGWRDYDICRFRGKVDLIEVVPGGVRLTDWKTGHKVPPKSELEADPQLRIYAALAAEQYAAPSYEIVFDYVRRGYRYTETVSHADALAMRETLTEVMGEIDRDEKMEAVPGPNCAGCFYKGGCKAYRSLDGLTTLPTDPAALARLYYALKARTEEVEAILRSELAAVGSIDIGDGDEVAIAPVAGRTTIPETTLAAEELATILQKPGGPDARATIVEAMTLNKSTVERLLKAAGHPEYIEAFLKKHGVVGPPGDRMVVRKARKEP